MIKVVSILLSGMLLVQGLNINIIDIIQLDKLMEHAAFHQEEYGDSFLVFLSKHYGERKTTHERNHQDENHQHEDLPFNHQGCSHHISIAYILQQPLIFVNKFELVFERSNNFYYQLHYNSLCKSGVFQPPRLA